MKKINTLAAAVLAAVMASPAAFADGWQPSFDFHGYLRAGVGQSRDNANIQWNKTKLGRLGNENDNYAEPVLGANVWQQDDLTFRIETRFVMQSHGGGGNSGDVPSANTDRGSHGGSEFDVSEIFGSVKGIIPGDKNAVLWAGKRWHARRGLEIWDQKYSQIDGEGVGIDDLQLGPGRLTAAWVRQDAYTAATIHENNIKISDEHRYIDTNVYSLFYSGNYWDGGWLEFMSATYVPNKGQSGTFDRYQKYDNGTAQRFTIELGQSWDGGYNNTIFVFGTGATAGPVQAIESWYDADKDNKSAKGYALINHGEVRFGSSNFRLAHTIGFTYGDKLDKVQDGEDASGVVDSMKLFKVAVRPAYQLTQYTKLLAEFGMFTETTKYRDGSKYNEQGQKYTIAYAIGNTQAVFSPMEIRFYASYFHAGHGSNGGTRGVSNYDNDAWSSDNYSFGVQVNAGW